MRRRRFWATIACAMLATACRSNEPRTIEDVRPGGYVCFPRRQPDSRGQPSGSDAATRPTTVDATSTQPSTTQPSMTQPATTEPATTMPATTMPTSRVAAHGAPGHWCALCAAAAARAAEQGRAHASLITPDSDLMSDLPPR